MQTLEGSAPVFAVPVPFSSSWEIDFGALKDYLHYLEGCDVTSILVNGTNGEFSSLTFQERKDVLEACRREFHGKIIAHVGSCSVIESCHLARHAQEFSDALLVLSPFYFKKVSAHGLRAFFQVILRATTASVFLYDYPELTQVPLSLDLVSDLVREFPAVQGLKLSGIGLDTAITFQSAFPELRIYLGSESLALDALDRGLAGIIAGSGNPLPEFLVNLAKAMTVGNRCQAEALHEAYREWGRLRTQLGLDSVAIAKAGLSCRVDGFPLTTRPPLVAAGSPEMEQIRIVVSRLLEKFRLIMNRPQEDH